MNIISIEGIKLYAYHGCLEEEALIGGRYIVDVFLEADLEKAENTDDLNETIDYVKVYEIVKVQMAIRSRLIEHVAKRISEEIRKEFNKLTRLEVKVTKLIPPMNGDVEKVSYTIKS